MTVLKPYPAYKPSGAEWLDDVPANWESTATQKLAGNESSYPPGKHKTGLQVRLSGNRGSRNGPTDCETRKKSNLASHRPEQGGSFDQVTRSFQR